MVHSIEAWEKNCRLRQREDFVNPIEGKTIAGRPQMPANDETRVMNRESRNSTEARGEASWPALLEQGWAGLYPDSLGRCRPCVGNGARFEVQWSRGHLARTFVVMGCRTQLGPSELMDLSATPRGAMQDPSD